MAGQRGFEDLECYQLALQVAESVYSLTKHLPADEKYNLVSQMRRAATSVTLNIAEGYGRYHYLDSLRFFYIARGSLNEVLSGFVLCERLQYVTAEELSQQRVQCHSALRSLNGYIRYLRKQQQGRAEYGNRAVHEELADYHIPLAPPPDE